MEISSIIDNLLIKYPLFGNVIVNLDFCYVNNFVNAPAYTNGKCIFYKKEFFDDYTESEREFIIAHEVLHVVLKHMFRNDGRDRDLLNFVEDAIINQLLARDGYTIPEGMVNIPYALDYSVDELYMMFLPKIEEIKVWMGENTYHEDLLDLLDELLEQMYAADLMDLMNENTSIRDAMMDEYHEDLKPKYYNEPPITFGLEYPSVDVKTAEPILDWVQILNANVVSDADKTVSFFEVEMDGIIRKEEKSVESEIESEILIDSSSSMQMQKIIAILRECKNVLKVGRIKVGFFDTEFYGWHDIESDADIDKLKIVGRGSNDFVKMAQTFSDEADNKIIITDGICRYPAESPGVIWVVINDHEPSCYDPDFRKKDVNYILVTEENIPNYKKLDKRKRVRK